MPFISTIRGSYGPQSGRAGRRANPLIASTGGTISEVGAFRIHTFSSTGANTFFASGNGNIEILLVAGGGGGGGGYQGGGGGAGGLIYNSSLAITSGNKSLSIGAGGRGATFGSVNLNGSDTTGLSYTAVGGGRGCGEMQAYGESASIFPLSGGSGGGGGHPTYTQANGTPGQGFPGGINKQCCANSGGGGAGEAGKNALSDGATAGQGGNGLSYSISGTSQFYAGGGGGSSRSSSTQWAGGSGGGGYGTGNNLTPQQGTDGLGGGGGGGGGGTGPGARGGNGVIIIRYPRELV